jgi:hypothetical protein
MYVVDSKLDSGKYRIVRTVRKGEVRYSLSVIPLIPQSIWMPSMLQGATLPLGFIQMLWVEQVHWTLSEQWHGRLVAVILTCAIGVVGEDADQSVVIEQDAVGVL